jgi:NADH:ubiquinone oxidoreductase subunit
MALPLKTTDEDLDKVLVYLRSQVGWVPLTQVRGTIPSKHADNRKIEAMRHLKLIERDGDNVKLTTDGREYAGADATKRAEIMRERLRADSLYNATVAWMHYQGKTTPTKTDIANYWHDHHGGVIGDAKGDALTGAVVFFMRMVGVADLGKFVAAGSGRETHLKMDEARLAEFATGEAAPEEPAGDGGGAGDQPPPPPPPPAFGLGSGLNVNVEIHIAADAKPATIEEIFKNMRKYLMEGSDSAADGG